MAITRDILKPLAWAVLETSRGKSQVDFPGSTTFKPSEVVVVRYRGSVQTEVLTVQGQFWNRTAVPVLEDLDRDSLSRLFQDDVGRVDYIVSLLEAQAQAEGIWPDDGVPATVPVDRVTGEPVERSDDRLDRSPTYEKVI